MPKCGGLRGKLHSTQYGIVPFFTYPRSSPSYPNRARALAYFFPNGSFATMTAIAALMLMQRPALAGPEGGTVAAGQAAISQAGSITNINQSTNKAIINWQGFSVGANETVNFNQPGASSVTLNRVIGNESSVINGALNANGQVFIVNSAGVLFGNGAQVNVGGLVASTRDISNTDFLAGNYTFSGNSSAAIVNQGRIRAREGGYVALLGKTVSNDGVISARLGTVAMAAGDKLTLNFEGNSLFDVTIDKGTLNALVENKRAIRADGGQVIMTAKAADQVLSAQVNNSGIIQARSVAALRGGGSGSVKIGKIKMIADGGATTVSGKLDASAPKAGDGGFIETSGDKVKIADNAVITTKSATGKSGTWLIDPTDFNIVAGSGAQTSSGIGATTLANTLGLGNVTIVTFAGGTENGDINVNAAVSWLADTILTLNAANNININAAVTASGVNAGLVLNYGGYNGTSVTSPAAGTNYSINNGASVSLAFSGSSTLNGAGLTINGNAYTLIHSMAQLAAINSGGNTTGIGFFALGEDLTATTTYSGAVVTTLTGTLAGLGHTISDLKISTSGSGALIGTLGSSSLTSATVRDVGMLNIDITTTATGGYAGGLVGLNWGNVRNAYATGKVIGKGSVGGLIGRNQYGLITDSHADVDVEGTVNVGGLVGWNLATTTANGIILNSYATGNVTSATSATARSGFGGLAGNNAGGTIINSYATGNVLVTPSVSQPGDGSWSGGLVGQNVNNSGIAGTIVNSYATGSVTSAGSFIGGLVGRNEGGNIKSSHYAGDVTATANGQYLGGLVGLNSAAGTPLVGGQITDSYATGTVTAISSSFAYVGGISGMNRIFSSLQTVSFNGNVIGGTNVGGIAGQNMGSINNATVSGTVTGGSFVGGIAGFNNSGNSTTQAGISGSSSSANVSGNSNVGGIAGANGTVDSNNGTGNISTSSSTGNVSGTGSQIGGLVGYNAGGVDRSYATGDVSGGPRTGGLVGWNDGRTANITDSFATGSVVGPGSGGLIGDNTSTGNVTNSTYRDVKAIARRDAARAEAARMASVIATNAETSTATPPDTKSSSAGTNAASTAKSGELDETSKVIEDKIKTEDAERDRRRKAAAANNAPRGGNAGNGEGFGAMIRSIDVDGKRFDLQDGDSKKSAPTGTGQ